MSLNSLSWNNVSIQPIWTDIAISYERETFKNATDNALNHVKIPQKSPTNSTQSLLKFLWFEFDQDLICDDFLWKNILDIWWGFSWVATLLNNCAWKIIVVDPIFSDKDINSILQENIDSQQEIISLRREYYHKDKTNRKVLSDIAEASLVLDEIKWWEQYSVENFPNVERNSSFWENMIWIENDSQDFIFLNYVISKDSVSPIDLINEIKRVKKQNWVLIICDYKINQEVISYIQKSFSDVEIKSDDNDWIVIVCK